MSSSLSRINARTNCASSLVVFVTLLIATNTRVAVAQDKKIPFDKLQQICHQFDQVMPQPPPVEPVLIGTLDASTGSFTWGGTVVSRETGEKIPIVDLSSIFANLKIPVFVPNLDPKITNLGGALGNTVDVGSLINNAINNSVGAHATGAGTPPAGATVHSGAAPAGAGGGIHAPPPRAKPGPAGGALAGAGAGVGTVTPAATLTGHSSRYARFYAPVRSGQVDMVFRVVNRPADAQVSITADERTATVTGDQVDIVVPPRVAVKFSLKCGDKAFDDQITFDRPPTLGCFTLEAYPLVFVYEPPGTSSSQKYTTTRTVGTTLTAFTSKENSDSKPVDTPFSTVTDMITLLDTVGKAVEKVKPEVGQGMQTASEILSAAWGSSETDEDVTHSVTDQKTLSVSMSSSKFQQTSTHQGPGKGDLCYFLIKPTFLWLVAQDEKTNAVYITVTLLGYQGAGSLSAELLRQGTSPMPSKEMQQLMLQLDPMAPEYKPGAAVGAGMDATKRPQVIQLQRIAGGVLGGALQRGRLVPADPALYVFGGGQSGGSFSRTVEESDLHSESTSDTITTTETGGFLSYIAKNVPQDGERHMRTVLGSSTGTSASDTVTVDVVYGAGPDEVHVVQGFYDTLFGTFAYQEVPAQEQQMMSGQAVQQGQPAANQKLMLVSSTGLKTAVTTDADGKFNFRSPLLEKGQYTIVAGNKEFPVKYEGKAVNGLKIDLSKGKEVATSAAQAASAKPIAKASKGGGGRISTTGIGAAEGDTAGAIRGSPPPPPAPTTAAAAAAGYATVPNVALKGRLGRIVVEFPKDAPCKDSRVNIYKQGDDKEIKNFYGSGAVELLPGTYAVSMYGRRVDGVQVTSRNDAKITTGVLRVHASNDTRTDVLDQDGKTPLGNAHGDHEFGLLAGKYFIQVNGQSEPVEIKPDEVSDF